MTRQNGTKIETNRKTEILHAAARMFVERGFRATSLQHIADVFGFTKPALYYHFRSKEDLLYAIVSAALEINEATAQRIMAQWSHPEDRLYRLIEAEVRDITTRQVDGSFTILVRDEMDELKPAHREEIARRRRVHFNRYRGLLDELKAARRLHDVDTTVATFGVIAAVNQIVRWFRREGRLTGEQVAHQVAGTAIRGLLKDGDLVVERFDSLHPTSPATTRRP